LAFAALYFNARASEAAQRDCSLVSFCLFEGVAYRTGWRTAAVGGVSADLPVARVWSIQAGPDVVVALSGRGGSRTRAQLRLRFGLGWRH
jgi:hypothetical protein